MLSNLPLDVDGKQIRVNDTVAYSAPDSCHMFIGRVFKITPFYVWMVPVGFEDNHQWYPRREFRQVVVIGEKR